MKTRPHTHHYQRGYFALSIALLISVVTSAIVLSLRSKLARMDAESILIDDREDYALARQLELIIHDSVQRVAGQRAFIEAKSSSMKTEINNRLSTVLLPPDSTASIYGKGKPPAPPELAFFPQSTSNYTRVPLSGNLDASDLPYGALGGLLQFGYYLPSTTNQTFSFVRTRNGDAESLVDVTASYASVPLTSQRLIIFNYPPDLGGSRLMTAPDLNYFHADDGLAGLIITQFTADGGVIDAVNAPGAMKSMTFYRHRSQVCEEIFQYLFKGDYLATLQSYAGTESINVSDIASALESHDGLYTEEQENTPPGEPLPPPTDNRFKMDVAQFTDNEVIYFHHPTASPVEITLLDSDTQSVQAENPIAIVLDGKSDVGTFKIRFQEFIDRPIFFVLTSTTVEFTGSTTGVSGIPAGAISGAYLMDEQSLFASDATSAQSAEIIYGAVLGHHTLLTNGYSGAQGHPVPVREFPNTSYYQLLEDYSPRALVVSTRSALVAVKSPNARVLAP